MAIQSPKPPNESDQAARDGVQRVMKTHLQAMTSGLDASTSAAQLSHAHEVFDLSVEDLAAGRGVAVARPVRWRYLVNADQPNMLATEVQLDNGAYRFAKVDLDSPFNRGTIDALNRAEDDSRVKNGNYELRILRVLALCVIALWLKDLANIEDLLIPIAPTNRALQAGTIYTTSAFEAALKAPAASKLGFDSSPQKA
jgi:hypothetical protein